MNAPSKDIIVTFAGLVVESVNNVNLVRGNAPDPDFPDKSLSLRVTATCSLLLAQ